MRRVLVIICIIISVFIGVEVNAGEIEKVKVGFPEMRGLSGYNKEGKPYGYIYDYLMEIRKYTGWEYEFVKGDMGDLVEKLVYGEIDLMGGFYYNSSESKKYELSKLPAGTLYSTIATRLDNTKRVQEYSSLGVFKGNTIGVTIFNNYCMENELNIELKFYNTTEDLNGALIKGEIDGIISNDVNVTDNQKIVDKISKRFHYLGVTKGNIQLIEELNEAIAYIDENKLDLKQELYNKHFTKAMKDEVSLSKEEIKYINEKRTLKVAYIKDSEPFSYYDTEKNTAVGIGVDILKKIGKDFGLEFKFIQVDNYVEGVAGLEKSYFNVFIPNVDITHFQLKREYRISNTYMKIPVQILSNKNSTEDKVLILQESLVGKNYFKEFKIRENMESVLETINDTYGAYSYADLYTVLAQTNKKVFPNVIVKPSRKDAELSFYINKNDKELFRIINKGINQITEAEKDLIIYDHIETNKREMELRDIVYIYVKETIFILAIIITSIITAIVLVYRMKIKYHRRINKLLKEKAELDSITNLYNRKAFEQRVKNYIEYIDYHTMSALVLIDIDHFKEVNDNLGHIKGDLVLKESAKVLNELFKNDIVGRWGGDEFVVFIKEYNDRIIDKLKSLCDKMDRVIKDDESKKSVKISSSVGMTIIDNAEGSYKSIKELYKEADRALYIVKENGRNGFEVLNKK